MMFSVVSGFFASDNGAHFEAGHKTSFFDSTGGLPGHKAGMFEGSVRSPSMVRWPGHVTPGWSDFVWAFWDVFPTITALAGVKTTAELDGINILPHLQGLPAPDERIPRYFYFTWVGDGGRGVRTRDPFIKRNGPGYTVRVGKWKGMVPHCRDQDLVKPSLLDRMRLYDLIDDPLETKDVASRNPEVVRDLKKLVVSENLTCVCYQCFWPARFKGLGRRLWRSRKGAEWARLGRRC